MQQSCVILLLFYTIYFVNGYGYSSNGLYCSSFKSKIYQVSITFPDLDPFYAIFDFQDNYKVVEYDNIGHGGSKAELGVDLTLDTHVGYYACHGREYVHASIAGWIYKTAGVPALEDNGALAVHNYKLYFSRDRETCTGSMEYSFYKTGSDPFARKNKPTLHTEGGVVTCKLLKFRSPEH
ncbi:unnamed protein product [Adineta steineri]|uniref:Uncharacterized protein n=1 Tax=Adineta steineri TaxID=433720 RepID=A0A819LC99_9BILA|nr:unnamed protein product [Adineta steineri]CAF3962436.1 unnamed protein product [Adineta steineri]CAF4211096.1 unnamed protein product [Adineta steineri]